MPRSSPKINTLLGGVTVNLLLLAGVALTFTPFFYMFAASFKPQREIFALPITLYPRHPTLHNYAVLFGRYPFWHWFFNSLLISGGVVVGGLFLASLGGFAFAKYRFPLQRVLFALVLLAMMLPFQVMLVPLFLIMVRLGWLNTYQGMIVPGFIQAFGLFYMRQYIMGIPSELMDAARIDGCSEFRIYWQIILPSARPALGVLGILFFTGSWNDFLWPLIVLSREEMFTLTLAIASFVGPYDIEYGTIMAGSFLGTLPILLLFILMQRQFIAGLTSGALKG
jgi:ABC-type glycerol-3-phosphate transport system permease component